MGGQIEEQDGAYNHGSKVKGRGSPRAMEEGILIGVVNVECCGQKSRGKDERGGNRGLQGERAMVVTNFSQGPEKRQGKNEMKGR